MKLFSLNKTLAFTYNIVIIIVISGLPHVVFSQESFSFPDSNAVWSEIYYPPINNDGIPPPEYHQFGIFNEDTIMNDKVYKKLYHTRELDFYKKTAKAIGGLRKDSIGNIYFCGDLPVLYDVFIFPPGNGEDYLIYNFNLMDQDTFILDVTFLMDEYFVVDSIKTGMIGPYAQKLFLFDFYVNSHYFESYKPLWIEGIGSMTGLLFPQGDRPTNRIFNELVCFTMNNQLLFKKYDAPTCNPLTEIQEINTLEKEMVHLYPNPAAYYAFLKFPIGDYNLTIYNVSGQIVYQQQIINTDLHKITLENFSNGVYSYLLNNGEHTFSGKFIINK
jgi:hypothetical protein